MTADPVEALAEALRSLSEHPETFRLYGGLYAERGRLAAAILAALSPGWCGHEDEVKGYYRLLDEGVQKQARLEDAEAEIARLREIEEAARALEAVEEDDESDLDVILFTLRGAGVLGTPMARILALRAALAPEASDD